MNLSSGKLFETSLVVREAVISPCGKYRYVLKRTWEPLLPPAVFICLNPSSATDEIDDPTVRKCQRFARSWNHYGSLVIVNLFAFRTSSPVVMEAAADPIGSDNDRLIAQEVAQAGVVIAAWGNHGGFLNRAQQVLDFLPRPIHCLALSIAGNPKHPLYMRKRLTPIPFHS